jgi:D-alanyl-D-alanine dipeptidase
MANAMRQLPTILCITVSAMAGLPAMTTTASVLERLDVRQCVVVTTDSWSSPNGTMTTFERAMLTSDWRPRQLNVPVVVGRAGVAWGQGVMGRVLPRVSSKSFRAFKNDEPFKAEGDDKSPAGIFFLRRIFGYARNAPTRMRYLALSANVVAIDDPRSRYYNQLVDKSKIEKPDWRTAEQMFRKDNLYKWGVVVDHNERANPGAGSCIFLHIWQSPTTSTSGCTAMSEKNLLKLIRWLNPASTPLLVQLPRPVYDELQERWQLPTL